VKPLPVADLSGLTLQYDMEILPVNGEEGNVRPDCVRYASERRLRSARHPVPSVCRLRPGVDGLVAGSFVFLDPGGTNEEYARVISVDPENQSFQAVVTKDHAAGERIRPTIWPTPVLREGDDLAFDFLAVASPDSGSDLTVVIQT
jgi:hypothetical protein